MNIQIKSDFITQIYGSKITNSYVGYPHDIYIDTINNDAKYVIESRYGAYISIIKNIRLISNTDSFIKSRLKSREIIKLDYLNGESIKEIRYFGNVIFIITENFTIVLTGIKDDFFRLSTGNEFVIYSLRRGFIVIDGRLPFNCANYRKINPFKKRKNPYPSAGVISVQSDPSTEC